MRALHFQGPPSREANRDAEQNDVLFGLCCPNRRTNRYAFVCLLPNRQFCSAVCSFASSSDGGAAERGAAGRGGGSRESNAAVGRCDWVCPRRERRQRCWGRRPAAAGRADRKRCWSRWLRAATPAQTAEGYHEQIHARTCAGRPRRAPSSVGTDACGSVTRVCLYSHYSVISVPVISTVDITGTTEAPQSPRDRGM